MLIVEARNVKAKGLADSNGHAHYEVEVLINERRIWKGYVVNHVRAKGAAELLRKIADEMDAEPSRGTQIGERP